LDSTGQLPKARVNVKIVIDSASPRGRGRGGVVNPIRSGLLTALQADVLARDIHWQGFHDIAGPAIGGCPDGSTTTIFVPGDSRLRMRAARRPRAGLPRFSRRPRGCKRCAIEANR
jgi:hypothetical protein